MLKFLLIRPQPNRLRPSQEEPGTLLHRNDRFIACATTLSITTFSIAINETHSQHSDTRLNVTPFAALLC
jgi:hypothetical protein